MTEHQCTNCNKPYQAGDEICRHCGFILPLSSPILSTKTILQKRYEIQELIHSGGMGYIYLATDKRLYERICIVKQVKEPVKSAIHRKKLEEEALSMAKLSHANVAMILDHFTEDNYYYLVVERIYGKTLSEIFKDKRGHLTEEEVVKWAIAICDVVSYLHSEGIIHRDISPDNIMLTEDGVVKFIDFGTLRELRDIAPGGTVGMGKYGYTPPEQWQGKPEFRSDIFAVGATLYYLLSGFLPQSKEYMTRQIPQKDDFNPSFPPIRSKNPVISPQLEVILQKALQLDINNRYSSAKEFADVLRNMGKVEVRETPVLKVEAEYLDFVNVVPKSSATKSFILRNMGTGRLTGKVSASHPWLKVSPNKIDVGSGGCSIKVVVDTKQLAPASRIDGTITINTNGGSFTIPVLLVVAVMPAVVPKQKPLKAAIPKIKPKVTLSLPSSFFKWAIPLTAVAGILIIAGVLILPRISVPEKEVTPVTPIVPTFTPELSPTTTPTPTSPEPAKTGIPNQVFKLNFTTSAPASSASSILAQQFCDEIKKQTNGGVEIIYYTINGTTTSGSLLADYVDSGTIDIGMSNIDATLGKFPATELTELPHGCANGWVATKVANDCYNKFQPAEWDKVHVLVLFSTGPAAIFTTKKPINKLEDLKGLIIRSNANTAKIIEALGAKYVSAPGTDGLDLMSRGIVDGNYASCDQLKNFNQATAVNYVTNVNALGYISIWFITMNLDKWNSLPKDYQEIITSVSQDYVDRFGMTYTAIGKVGVDYFLSLPNRKMIDLSPEETAKFVTAAKPGVDAYMAEKTAKGIPAQDYDKYINERVAYWTKLSPTEKDCYDWYQKNVVGWIPTPTPTSTSTPAPTPTTASTITPSPKPAPSPVSTTPTSPVVWSPISIGATNSNWSIWGSSSNDIFVAGGNGAILHYNGSAWSSVNINDTVDLYSIWGRTTSDVFAAGESGFIFHYDGSKWSQMNSGTTNTFVGVWGSSANDIFAITGNGNIFHYNGSAWSSMINFSNVFSNIWGNSGSDVFIVGDGGAIYHYGGSWFTMRSGTTNDLAGVWGSSSRDVFAVGKNGTIIHYDGSTWSAMNSGTTNNLWGIWGSSGSDIFAVGNYGTILHYNGSTWAPMNSGTTNHLWSVWGSSANQVYIAGSNVLLQFQTGTK